MASMISLGILVKPLPFIGSYTPTGRRTQGNPRSPNEHIQLS
jgi:hypothetical protein